MSLPLLNRSAATSLATVVLSLLERPWLKILLFALVFLLCWLGGMRTAHAG